jgi:hypothetical protein
MRLPKVPNQPKTNLNVSYSRSFLFFLIIPDI